MYIIPAQLPASIRLAELVEHDVGHIQFGAPSSPDAVVEGGFEGDAGWGQYPELGFAVRAEDDPEGFGPLRRGRIAQPHAFVMKASRASADTFRKRDPIATSRTTRPLTS